MRCGSCDRPGLTPENSCELAMRPGALIHERLCPACAAWASLVQSFHMLRHQRDRKSVV